MRILLRIIAAFCVLIALFLVYAVIAAVASDEGARAGVAVLYIVIAAVLGFAASRLWNSGGGKTSAP